ncbi:DUF3368 domain-containing protein [Dyadobacter sp. CY312]|uniref:DUF3368 domain-containing protein n=1 Tax=Dyadobacter sp. CY312 TaxID=2907303 RepID=UPI001F2AE7DC|nr:DUF3368 domain-containing protein [Dyadobacter sp. CY312]MCE7040754.1 DUF3368 domain-containing protein [Dyadobacter sp. CY312]
MPESLVIADTSCLILLSKVDELAILKLNYNRILITPEIANEFNQDLPDWIEVIGLKDRGLQLLLQDSLDLGESTALALAIETDNATVILDDLKARKLAQKLGLKITGTIGVIIKAKLRGNIPSAKAILNKILSTDFRINSKTVEEAIKLAGESP